MSEKEAGFQEIEHMADVEIKVWGDDLNALFIQAAKGMYHLSQIREEDNSQTTRSRTFSVTGMDTESLLVAFLNEILFYLETERIAFQKLDLEFQGNDRLQAQLEGTIVKELNRDIKAVTFHNLEIQELDTGWQVRIVFDV